MTFDIVVAADERNGIGRAGRIPWELPADMARFKKLTLGATVIMGRRTWESLPVKVRPLPQRRNVVLTSDDNLGKDLERLGVGWSRSLAVATLVEPPPYFVIGGGDVYRAALMTGHVGRIHLTRVVGSHDCDTFWPGVPEGFTLESWEPGTTVVGQPSFAFETWRRP